MSLLNPPDNLAGSLQALTTLVVQLKTLVIAIGRLLRNRTPRYSYENVLLDIVLDIQDRRGRRAVLDRRQVVRFLVEESGVVRDLVWGDGHPMDRYHVQDGRRLGIIREGSRQVVLLGLLRRPARGEEASLHSRRMVRNALLQSSEYCEALVERPTARLAMTVFFPQSRPPRNAHLVTSAPIQASQKLPVSYTADGRAVLTWHCLRPTPDSVYSLRWSW